MMNSGPTGEGLPRDFQSDASERDGRSGTNRAIIVAASPIDRIVIARTIERIYLKPMPIPPESVLETLRRKTRIVIIDALKQEEVIEPLLAELARQRQAAKGSPRVLMIVEPDQHHLFKTRTDAVDATFVRPITPDRLQRAIERVLNS